jgi:2-oxo-4-hydroxy-4-carboxy-5-ureidoimidazoline decarboxylase
LLIRAMTPVPLETLNAMTEGEFSSALADIFEHAPWVAARVAAARPFASASALHAAMMDAVRAAGEEPQLALIRNHPDLAGKAARRGDVTADSRAEQSSAGLDRLSEEEYATFDRLNGAYRAKFAIPFIICVRRHSKDSILDEMQARLDNTPAAERDAALREIFRIVALRLDGRIAGAEHLKVHGRLSTHVLDTYHGRPAEGVAVTLVELARAGEERTVASGVTNADGRTAAPLIAGRPVPIGRYELRFSAGAYFARNAVPAARPPFLDEVPIRFGVAEAEGHYHVPLLVTPWSYSTYRGS